MARSAQLEGCVHFRRAGDEAGEAGSGQRIKAFELHSSDKNFSRE